MVIWPWVMTYAVMHGLVRISSALGAELPYSPASRRGSRRGRQRAGRAGCGRLAGDRFGKDQSYDRLARVNSGGNRSSKKGTKSSGLRSYNVGCDVAEIKPQSRRVWLGGRRRFVEGAMSLSGEVSIGERKDEKCHRFPTVVISDGFLLHRRAMEQGWAEG